MKLTLSGRFKLFNKDGEEVNLDTDEINNIVKDIIFNPFDKIMMDNFMSNNSIEKKKKKKKKNKNKKN
jgi:hypothetical protein